jgi:hypothetical protein
MAVVSADYDPGTLTASYIILLCGIGVVVCLVLAGGMALCKDRPAAQRFLIAAGIVACVALLLALLAVVFAKRLHLL